jgi:NitT/TauT family transport system substrate-binding protein
MIQPMATEEEGVKMTKQTSIRCAIFLTVLATLVLGATFVASAAGDLDEVRVALKWLPQAQFAGYYVAEEMGFYEEEGLFVTILPGGANEPQDLVAAGAAQFGVTWLGILLEAQDQGVPLVNIAQVFQSSGFRYISWADSGIVSPTDLRNREIETWYGGNEVPLLALLQKYGLNPDTDLTLQSQAFDMNAFLERRVSASAAMSYNELDVIFESIVADALGISLDELLALSPDAYREAQASALPAEQLTVFDVNREGVAMLEDMIFTSEAFLSSEENRDVAVRFVRASLRGWEYARDHRTETIDIVLAQDTNGSMSPLHQSLMLDDVLELIWEPGTQLGYLDPASFQQTADIALQFGVIDNAASSTAYTHEIWEQATSD